MTWLALPYVISSSVGKEVEYTQRTLPFAIYELRRALFDEPWNATLRAGLATARSHVATPNDPVLAAMLRPESVWYPSWLLHPIAAIVGYVAYVVVCLALTRWVLTRNRRVLIVAALAVVPALLPLVGAIVERERHLREKTYPYIVFVNDTPLRVGNGDSYPVIMQLPKGTEARIVGGRGGWRQIQLGSGAQGWAQQGWVPNAP